MGKALVQVTWWARVFGREGSGWGVVALFVLLLSQGRFFEPERYIISVILAGAAWLAVSVIRGFALLEKNLGSTKKAWLTLEIATLLLVAIEAVSQFAGGVTHPLHAIVFVVMAGVAVAAKANVVLAFTVGATALLAQLYFVTENRTDLNRFGVEVFVLIAIAAVHTYVTKRQLISQKRRHAEQLQNVRERAREDARLFRLAGDVHKGSGSTPEDSESTTQEKAFRASSQEVHHGTYHVLELLHTAMHLNSCTLLVIDRVHQQLKVAERISGNDQILAGPYSLGTGILGAIVKEQRTFTLSELKPNYKGISYYQETCPVYSFIGVPVFEGKELLGVLCADRQQDLAFSLDEEEVFRSAGREILRAIQNERVFIQLEKSKREQTILHRASQALGAALSEDEVMDATLNAASEIAPYDLCAVTTYNPEQRKHHVLRAFGTHAQQLDGLSFKDNNSLVAMVVKTHHYLPYRGEFDPAQQFIFNKRHKLRGTRSLLILPLLVQERAIGTLVLASEEEQAFGDGVRSTLQVLANQFSVALANSASLRRLEEMATTDGLTGCLNKRAFTAAMERKLRSSERFGHQISLVVIDLDHFKNINDTYGHAAGDIVLKGLGRILAGVKRETDIVARFGGEEFCLLCEQTDLKGALLLANRIREEVESTEFHSEIGKLRVTCSLGVATYPLDAKNRHTLFEAADKALYVAKRSGRNQVRSASKRQAA